MSTSTKTYADITIANASRPDIRPTAVRALIDRDALHARIPEALAEQLRLDIAGERLVSFGGSVRVCSYAGPLEIWIGERGCFTGALVTGEEVVLGSIPLDDVELR